MAVPDHLVQRFAHHPPVTQRRIDAHGSVREAARMFAALLEELLPASREAALAQTAVQEAALWANAALAIHEGDVGAEPKL